MELSASRFRLRLIQVTSPVDPWSRFDFKTLAFGGKAAKPPPPLARLLMAGGRKVWIVFFLSPPTLALSFFYCGVLAPRSECPAHTTVNAVVCCGVLWARKHGVFPEKSGVSALHPGAKAVDWKGIQVQKRLTGRVSRCKFG